MDNKTRREKLKNKTVFRIGVDSKTNKEYVSKIMVYGDTGYITRIIDFEKNTEINCNRLGDDSRDNYVATENLVVTKWYSEIRGDIADREETKTYNRFGLLESIKMTHYPYSRQGKVANAVFVTEFEYNQYGVCVADTIKSYCGYTKDENGETILKLVSTERYEYEYVEGNEPWNGIDLPRIGKDGELIPLFQKYESDIQVNKTAKELVENEFFSNTTMEV